VGETLEAGDGTKLEHGGDLSEARRLFPAAPEPWIDLSTGINPVPYPLPCIPAAAWQLLPSSADEAALLTAARAAYRAPDHAGIVAAAGTQILIGMLPLVAGPPREVAVLGPTYGEHAHAWREAGFTVREVADVAEIGGAGVVVTVNPNNPDGRIVPQAELTRIAAGLAGRGGLLVVDEAFADFTPDISIAPALPPATIVLRSFGKTYGLAGLRLGFAMGPAELMARLAGLLGPWAVPGPALHVGRAALADRDWLAAAREAREQNATRLDTLLASSGRVIGGTALFRLLETPEAPAIFKRLGRHGIHVRRFAAHPHRLRFGLPGDEAAWQRLAAALAADDPAR
jgi:cobalamin biosynthetic protein CobC